MRRVTAPTLLIVFNSNTYQPPLSPLSLPHSLHQVCQRRRGKGPRISLCSCSTPTYNASPSPAAPPPLLPRLRRLHKTSSAGKEEAGEEGRRIEVAGAVSFCYGNMRVNDSWTETISIQVAVAAMAAAAAMAVAVVVAAGAVLEEAVAVAIAERTRRGFVR